MTLDHSYLSVATLYSLTSRVRKHYIHALVLPQMHTMSALRPLVPLRDTTTAALEIVEAFSRSANNTPYYFLDSGL